MGRGLSPSAILTSENWLATGPTKSPSMKGVKGAGGLSAQGTANGGGGEVRAYPGGGRTSGETRGGGGAGGRGGAPQGGRGGTRGTWRTGAAAQAGGRPPRA